MEKFSVVIFSCNEYAQIPKTLEYASKLSDDIVVVDCSDNSEKMLNIAKAYGAKFHKVVRLGESAPYKEWAFSKAKNNWVLQLDTDEKISHELAKSLGSLVNSGKADAYRIRRYEDERQKFFTWQTRLVDRRKAYCMGFVHSHIRTTGRIEQLRQRELYMLHLRDHSFTREMKTLLLLKRPREWVWRDWAVILSIDGPSGFAKFHLALDHIKKIEKGYSRKELNAVRAILKKEGVTHYLGLQKEETVSLIKRNYSNSKYKASDLLIHLVFKKYRTGRI